MAHEITRTDQVVLNTKGAWHGLGVIVPEAEGLDIDKARRIALPWDPIPAQLLVRHTTDATLEDVPTHKAIVRSDNQDLLAVVSSKYNIVSNTDLAKLAEGISTEGVQVESAGSLRGGKRVWFLLRDPATDFNTHTSDRQKGYSLITAGHDGSAAVTITPTTVRVVCNNTLRIAIGGADRNMTFGVRHTENLSTDLDAMITAAKACLTYGRAASQRYAASARHLSFVPLSDEQRQRLNTDIYQHIWGAIPEEGKGRDRAVETLANWDAAIEHSTNRLEYMRGTAWAALNAVTLCLNHNTRTRGDRKAQLLAGPLADATHTAYVRTMEFVGA